MENLTLIESISTWQSTGVTRITIVTPGGEGKIQVDLLSRDDTKFGRTAVIWDLYVSEEHRRKGIARQLMQHAIQRAKDFGFATATLEWNLVDSKREIAWWYTSLGFDEKEFGNTYALMIKNLI